MMKNGLLKSAVFFGLMTIFSSCGDGGGGHRGDSVPPAVNITSHSDGQVVTGSAAITVQWTATDNVGVTSSWLTLNGVEQPVTPGSNGIYSASVMLAYGANTIVIQASDAAGNTTSKKLHLTFGQAASVVIGQANFDSGAPNQGGAAGANTINEPYGNAAVNNGVLYLTDYGNNRMLGFDTVPTVNNASANFVLGQPDFTTTTAGIAGNKFEGPQTVVIDGGKMFAVDYWNNRVLIWDPVPTTSHVPANVAVGQPDLMSKAGTCTAAGLYGPESIYVVETKLIVADSFNNRVLIWDPIPTTNPAPAANLVLGQANFTSCNANRDGAVEANTLSYPSSIWSDGIHLIVADANNYRVLIWNDFPTTNGQAADVVMGQPNMVSNVLSAASQSNFGYPYFLHSNGTKLFVSDSDYNRVLIWDSIPAANQALADRVLGQGNFTDSSTGFGTSATQFNFPAGVFAFDNKLIVTDTGNNRYLIFEAP